MLVIGGAVFALAVRAQDGMYTGGYYYDDATTGDFYYSDYNTDYAGGCDTYYEGGQCDPMICYSNGWCEQPNGCPPGSEEECMWTHADGWKCECMDTDCGQGMVPYVDWKTNTPVCIAGHEIEIVREYEPTATDRSWEKDCGQGRDEWGNLMWGGEKQYNWSTQMCEERLPCQDGFVKNWGQKGEFCMHTGSKMHCGPDATMTTTWDNDTYEETISCVHSHVRGAVKHENAFQYHDVLDENEQHWEEEVADVFAHSATGMDAEGDMVWTEEEYEHEAVNYAGETDMTDNHAATSTVHHEDKVNDIAIDTMNDTFHEADMAADGTMTHHDTAAGTAGGYKGKHKSAFRKKQASKKSDGGFKGKKAAFHHKQAEEKKDRHMEAPAKPHGGFAKKANRKHVRKQRNGGN